MLTFQYISSTSEDSKNRSHLALSSLFLFAKLTISTGTLLFLSVSSKALIATSALGRLYPTIVTEVAVSKAFGLSPILLIESDFPIALNN